MFYVEKTVEIAAGHCLNLPYESKCNRPHGHNYQVTVRASRPTTNEHGMVIDFTRISEVVKALDHRDLNAVFADDPAVPPGTRTTAEQIAEYIYSRLLNVLPDQDTRIQWVEVRESANNIARFEPGGRR